MEFLTNNWIYFALVGLMAFVMMKGGGCCGSNTGDEDSQTKGGGCCGGTPNSDNEAIEQNENVQQDK